MSNNLAARLRLVRSPGIGPVTFRQSLARFGGAEAALAAVPDLARRGGGRMPEGAGREVMAVPGSPLDQRAQCCSQLIRVGATLVQNAADVLEGLRTITGKLASPTYPFDHHGEAMPIDPPDAVRERVVELLGPSPVPVDEIVRLSGSSPGAKSAWPADRAA